MDNSTSSWNVTTESLDSSSDDPMFYAYTLLGLIGVLDNVFVVIVITMYKPMKQRIANLYIINQSIIDSIGSLVFLIGLGDRNSSVDFSGLSGELFCCFWKSGAVMWGMYSTSTFNLIAITIDRYAELVHPIWHRVWITKTKVFCIMAFVWVSGMGFQLCVEGITSGIVDRVCIIIAIFPTPAHKSAASVMTFIFMFALPVAVMLYVYIRIALSMHRRVGVAPTDNTTLTTAEKDKEEKMACVRRNIFKTMVTVSVCFSLCWAPNQIWFLMYGLGYPFSFEDPYYHFSSFMAYMNLIINPFIYTIQYEQFQTAVKVIIFSKKSI